MPNVPKPEDLVTWMQDVDRRLRAVEGGQRVAVQAHAAYHYADYVETYDATWTPLWEVPVGYVEHDALLVRLYVRCSAATTAEVRLLGVNVTGSPTTSAVAVPTGDTIVTFAWRVPGLVLASQGRLFHVQARVTSGAGRVSIYPPQAVRTSPADLIGATTTGV